MNLFARLKIIDLSKLVSFILIFFFISCKKDINNSTPVDPDPIDTTQQLPDLSTKIISSLSGFVTDENNHPVLNATVKSGGLSTLTDKYGYFNLQDANVVKLAAVVTVIKEGYFPGTKTYMAETNKAAFFRIRLLPKTNVGTFAGSVGGTVTTTSAVKMIFPANAVITAGTGAGYPGDVHVSAQWLDPTGNDLANIMPGDLRATNTAGEIKVLTSYGMMAVELTGTAGELLQIAPGKKCNLSFPIPVSISGSAPTNLPLWYFDETTGLWKEEGTATKNGSEYTGDVSHFSFWNCDVPANYVQVNMTLKVPSGKALAFAQVKLILQNNPQTIAYGYTNAEGYVAGAVPASSQFTMEVRTNNSCVDAAYTQTFTTSNTTLSLGDITVTPTNGFIANISGTVTNCNNAPVTDGFVMMVTNGNFYRFPLNSSGTYDLPYLFCNTAEATFSAVDNTVLQQNENPVTFTIVDGNNIIPNIQACGAAVGQFVKFTVDDQTINLIYPGDSIAIYENASSARIDAFGYPSYTPDVDFMFDKNGIAVNSSQLLQMLSATTLPSGSFNFNSPINVQVTEFGGPGEYISGNFSGSVTDVNPPNTIRNVSCSFRVKRD